MFAVIRTGGKQYKVSKDDVIKVERLEAEEGATVTIDDVLMFTDGSATKIGEPKISGATVMATLVEHIRAPKVIIFKKKRRQNYRRKKGHRQNLSVLRITDIKAA